MKRYLVGAFLLALGASAAIASGYSELNLGIEAYKDEDWALTVAHMTNALASPDLPPGYRTAGQFDRGDAYLELGKVDLAIGDYSAVIAADPNYLEALQHRGKLYAYLRKFDLAIADYSTLISRRSAIPQLYADRGGYYEEQRKFDLATADFSQIVALIPARPIGYTLRGEAYRISAKYDLALADLNKAIEIDDKDVRAYQNRAELHNYRMEYEAARSDYEKVLSIDPNQGDSIYNLGTTLWFEGHYSEASAMFSRFLATSPTDLYGMLWQAISTAHDNAQYLDDLRKQSAAASYQAWPRPVINVFLGTLPADTLLKTASGMPGGASESNICEADFFIAERYVLAGNNAAALPLLHEALSICPQHLAAYYGTVAELKRLQ